MAALISAVSPAPTFRHDGFTLTEMSVVLVIVALLIGGMLIPLAAQQDIRTISETDATLKTIHEALLGYAATQGRLPCPASAGSHGAESFATGENRTTGVCSNFFDGFVPAATLGVHPTDNDGFAIDAWGQRIRYAVANKTVGDINSDVSNAHIALTSSDGIKLATMTKLPNASLLFVCNTASGIGTGNCGTATALAGNAPAVVFSTGKNGASTGADEQANTTVQDGVFVSHESAPSAALNGEFDDQVTWLSPHILVNRMISAGRLP